MSQEPSSVPSDRPAPHPARSGAGDRRFSRFAWALLAYTVAVAVWGAFVRATGSGAGCGSHWPLCNGEVLPRQPALETLIELTHRITSGLIGLLVIGLVVWAARRFGHHRVTWGAVATLVFTVIEGAIGAGLVKFELVADNDSIERGVVMAAHLVNTFILLGTLALTAQWASGTARPRWRGQGATGWLLGLGLVGTTVVGASGAIAALGDTLFPVDTFLEGLAQDLSPTAHVLIELRIWHPFLALGIGAFLLFSAVVIQRLRPSRTVGRLATGMGILYGLQIVGGLVNVALAAPVWMQLVHLAMAYGVWLLLVLLTGAALAVDAPRAALAAGDEPAESAVPGRPAA